MLKKWSKNVNKYVMLHKYMCIILWKLIHCVTLEVLKPIARCNWGSKMNQHNIRHKNALRFQEYMTSVRMSDPRIYAMHYQLIFNWEAWNNLVEFHFVSCSFKTTSTLYETQKKPFPAFTNIPIEPKNF